MAHWLYTLEIKDEWNKASNDEITSVELAQVIVTKLKAFGLVGDIILDDVIEDFEDFISSGEDDDNEFNFIFNKLYDWADLSLDGKWGGMKNCWVATF
jgi:hypothetical protein